MEFYRSSSSTFRIIGDGRPISRNQAWPATVSAPSSMPGQASPSCPIMRRGDARRSSCRCDCRSGNADEGSCVGVTRDRCG